MGALKSLLRTFLAAIAFCALTQAADLLDDVRRGEGLAKADPKANAAEVKRILADLGKNQADGRFYAGLLQVRLLMLDGKADKAKAGLSSVLPKGGVDALAVDERLAYADTLRVIGASADAMAIANRIGEAESGTARVRAAELMGDISADHQRWPEAIDWLKSAIANLDAMASSSSSSGDVDKAYRAKLAAKLAKLRDAMDLATHGLGFMLYQTANAQRFGRRFGEALATYDRLLELHAKNKGKPVIPVSGMDDPRVNDLPIHDLYAAASKVYRAYALIGLTQYKEATQSLMPVAQDARHPYRGEAMRLLGDIALEDSGDVVAAEASYTAAMKALADDGEMARSMDRFHVPGVSVERTKPPEEMRSVRGWGNLVWFKPEPDQVINAETCTWYVGFQTMQAQVKRSFCRFMRRDLTGAQEDIEAIKQYDQADAAMTASGSPSNYLRLRDGYRSGGLYATDAEMQGMSPKIRPFLMLADLSIEVEEYTEASLLHDRIQKRFGDRLSDNEKAYIRSTTMAMRALQGDFKGLEQECDAFLATHGKTPSAPRVWMLKAARTKQVGKAAVYQKIADLYPGTETQLDALMSKGMILSEGSDADRAAAKAAFEQVVKLAPKTAWQTGAESFLFQMKTQYGD